MNRQQWLRIVAGFLALVLVLTLVGGLLSVSGDDAPTGPTQPNGLTISDDTTPLGPPVTTRFSDLPTISEDELPEEAIATAGLVLQARQLEAVGEDTSNLFPYPQDGSVFQNREGLLPAEEAGYYAEYTVPTPESDDRGELWRLVVGAGGEIYYTDDHYESFREVIVGA